MKELSIRVKNKAKEYGADLVGIASVERFKDAPEGFHPEDFLEGAKSVIVAASHFPYSIVDSWENSPFSYLYYGYVLINKELGKISFYLSKFLERAGYRTFPVVPTVYMRNFDYERLEGVFSHLHAAYAAGLGEFGFSNCFITPEYGTKVRFCSVITEAELKPDEIYDGEPLCDRCMKCLKACPTGARTNPLLGKFTDRLDCP